MLLQTLLVFALFSSLISASTLLALLQPYSTNILNWNEFNEALDSVQEAMIALQDGDLAWLESILAANGTLIQQAYDRELTGSSLLYMSLFTKYQNLEVYQLLARFGVETGGSEAFRQNFYKFKFFEGEKILEGSFFQELVKLNLVRLEDLWAVAIWYDYEDLFEWLLTQGADINYRIPRGSDGEFQTVLRCCEANDHFEMCDKLIHAGVDLNASLEENLANFWEIVVVDYLSPLYFRTDTLELIVSGTKNLFTPFIYDSFPKEPILNPDYVSEADEIISQELLIRKSKLDLCQFDMVNEEGWTLLDMVNLRIFGGFPLTIKVLREAGLPANFPLNSAHFSKDWALLRVLLESGQVDYNEQAFAAGPILMFMVRCEEVSADLIELAIDRGASVNFPSGRLYSNAYICAREGRKQNPLPEALMRKIWSLLSVNEKRKARRFFKE